MCKNSRDELVRRIINTAGLPPGKDSENYFTKEQLEVLYLKIVELKDNKQELIEQVATLTERILDNDNRSAGSSESESL